MESQFVTEEVEREQPSRLFSLTEALSEVSRKRAADVIRFRSCCADPRASK